MMRSMYSGVSGLKTHQTKMDVIGNNIANVNTVAYKSNSITFSELMYQTTQKASGPNELTGTGGTNARQIGLGVQSAAINTAISTQGATQTTGNPFDLCITGDAFFVVSDGLNNYFTRAGAFNVDAIGNLVMSSNGYNVMGWEADDEKQEIIHDTVKSLKIMEASKMTYSPEATSKGYFSGILDKNDEEAAGNGLVKSLNFYDNLGYSYTAKFGIHATTDPGVYYVTLDDIIDGTTLKSIVENYPAGTTLSDIATIGEGAGFSVNISQAKNYVTGTEVLDDGSGMTYRYPDPADPTNTLTGNFLYASITDVTLASNSARYAVQVNTDADGKVTVDYDFSQADDTNVIAQKANMKEFVMNAYGMSEAEYDALEAFTLDEGSGVLTVTKKTVNGSRLTYDTDTGYFNNIDASKSITLDFANSIGGTTLEQFKDIEIDWSATNMYNNSGTSTIGGKNGNTDGIGTGRKLGNMSGITIQTNGKIYASYDNGMTRLLGQIAVAEFSNAQGLEKAGENLYEASLNSGEFDGVGVDVTGSGGYMTTGVLEMSNVDLSSEFTEMITTQRGFQANSRIITVSDTMLEELVNLKR